MALWAIGRHDLGLMDDDFWTSNPAMFDELMGRKLAARREADYRAGVLAVLIYNNIPSNKKKRQVQPETFFPSLKKQEGG